MRKARAVSLRSGSSGNSIFIESQNAKILVDVGVNAKQIEQALAGLEVFPEKINAILITHEHSDHIKGLGVMARRYKIPIYLNEKTYQEILPKLGKVDLSLFHFIEASKLFQVEDIAVKPFSIPHDAVDPLAFRFHLQEGDISICTDLGYISTEIFENIKGSDLLFLEANYDVTMLQNGPYPYYLKQRISGSEGHLSNLDCGTAMCQLIKSGTERFVLSHLSQNNNFPELAQLTVEQYLKTKAMKQNKDYEVEVAKRSSLSQVKYL